MSKNNDIKIRLIKNKKELEEVFRIREIVFIREQKVQKNVERDKFDNISKHLIILYKNEPVGCARIRLIDKKAKLERIGLLKIYRGKGFGKNIVNYLIKYCKKKNIKEVYINSQYYLMNYYKKFGFKTRGKSFMEAGIKHIEMYLNQVKQKE